jgi:WD40 repeat protein
MRHSALSLSSNVARAVLAPNNAYAAVGSANGFVYAFNAYTAEFEIDLGNPKSGTARKRARERHASSASSAAAAGVDKDDVLAGWGSATSGAASGGGGGSGGADAGGRDAEPPHADSAVIGLDWAPDGRYLASCDDKGRVVLWTD